MAMLKIMKRGLSQAVQAAITKHYRLGALNQKNRNLFLMVLGSPRSGRWHGGF